MSEETRPTVLIVDDEEVVHETIGGYVQQLGYDVHHAFDGELALDGAAKLEPDLVLLDIRMPGLSGIEVLEVLAREQPMTSVVMVSGHGTMELAIEALRKGATDFLTKPIKLKELDAVLEKTRRIGQLRRDRQRLQETIGFMQNAEYIGRARHRLLGESAPTRRVREQIRLAVERRFDTILISGETGSGKEVVAREIHLLAGGESRPFIAVSCPAIPESLIESELFGHVKGAFTGAADARAGSFELADGGTLFLDEIADLSPAAQAKILRALETRTVRRVGGAREISVEVRVVAATNVPLDELVERKRFRQDLFYRLNVFNIDLEPLRSRREDIVPLAEHFLQSFAQSRGLPIAGFDEEACRALERHAFPGNARELRNVVERAAAMRGQGRIGVSDLGLPEAPNAGSSVPPPAVDEHNESRRIQLVLDRVRWNRKEAARLLDMPYSTLRYKMKKYGLD